MELNINSPQYYTNKFGVDDEVYRLCQDVYEFFRNKSYSECIDIIGIIPIVASKEILNKGLCKSGIHCEPAYGFASISKNIDFEEYVSANIEKKKELIMKCVLSSVKLIKTKGKFDIVSFEKDFSDFLHDNNIDLL